ncbi:hypothetical protein BCR39DRAFT_477181 [Naematelia encephala]|uniref:N-acetyl-D-glucosamine kinase n=1 Tax=Naematelia encephala TaxID=71784 RepID=A0A1Y2BJG4_9TREE|nr:hypothetical protein BCR39DRAFT_477181 [Naematelia encephala]
MVVRPASPHVSPPSPISSASSSSPTSSSRRLPSLVLCADGGGSKVHVCIRTSDGLEVRGTAGPCNVSSVGHALAVQRLLLATYRALACLPPSHLPSTFQHPLLPSDSLSMSSSFHIPTPNKADVTPYASHTQTPQPSRPSSPSTSATMPSLNVPLFAAIWLGLAGLQTPANAAAFTPKVCKAFNAPLDRVRLTNDVILLAAPVLSRQEFNYVAAVVCGTGTVGRTIRLDRQESHGIGLEVVGYSRGWGHLLCDEGSAFFLGRAALRSILFALDRSNSSHLFATKPDPISTPTFSTPLPLHRDLLAYFATPDPADLIGLVSLSGPGVEGVEVGEAVGKRNALVAGAARVILRWAFPEEQTPSSPSPPSPPIEQDQGELAKASREEALRLAQECISPLIELTLALLGDGSVVKPQETALALGGGLMMSPGYRGLLLTGLKARGVEFGSVGVVSDAAGVGARGLAAVEFGLDRH